MSFMSGIQRIFTPPGTGFLQAQAEAAQQNALQAAKDSEAETRKAIEDAKIAAQGPLDSESARKAAEERMRQLLGMQGAAWSFATPPAGSQMLFGGGQ